MNVSTDIYKLLIKVFMLQLMKMYRCRGCRPSAMSTVTCANTLSAREVWFQRCWFPTFISKMELSLGTGGVSRSPCLVKRPQGRAVGWTSSHTAGQLTWARCPDWMWVDVSCAVDWPQRPSWVWLDALDRHSQLIPWSGDQIGDGPVLMLLSC